MMLSSSLLFPVDSFSSISFTSGKWQTTFNCNEQTQLVGTLNCDGMEWWHNYTGAGSYRTQILSVANNTSGTGGRGARFWIGEGQNNNTGTIKVNFPSYQKELWIRWYIRHQAGYAFSSLEDDKNLYIYSAGNVTQVIPEFYTNTYRLASQSTPNPNPVITSNYGWNQIMGGSVGDGLWHCFEIHLKMDTNGSNGVGQLWVDGVLRASNNAVNWSNNSATAQQGWEYFIFEENQKYISGGPYYVDYDDMVVYNTTPPNVDAQGNAMVGPIGWSGTSSPSTGTTTPVQSVPAQDTTTQTTSVPATVLFEETFESTALSSKGWYDNTSPVFTSTETIPGSSKAIEFRFNAGESAPVNGGSMRRKFTESDSVYLRYYVKYNSAWVGSQTTYHPHEFYFLTNKSGDWSGLASTPMTAYVEQNQRVPVITIQDSTNINTSGINQNLVSTTENRAVAGCNGSSDAYGDGTCYSSGGAYYNGKTWKPSGTTISTGAWHKVEAYLKLNSVSGGKGVADGVIQYWLDGQLIMNNKNVMFRTAQNADMKFNQMVIAPWIGDGSPIAQTFWVDDITLATAAPTTSVSVPAPAGLQLRAN